MSLSEVLIDGVTMPVFDASIRVQNVVASVTLNQKFDLNAIVKGNPLVEYCPEKFPGLVFRLKKAQDCHPHFPYWEDGLHWS